MGSNFCTETQKRVPFDIIVIKIDQNAIGWSIPPDFLICKDITPLVLTSSFTSGNDPECPKQVMSENTYVIADQNLGIAVTLDDIFTSTQNCIPNFVFPLFALFFFFGSCDVVQ